ncbi:MAG: hypothetical protein ABIG20_02190 [archaeon]
MVRRQIDKKKYITILSATTLIFLVGIMLGQQIAEARINEVIQFEDALGEEALALDLKKELLAENICEIDVLDSFREKNVLGERLSLLEARLGSDDQQVQKLKNKYSLLSIQQYLLVKQYKEECDDSVSIILFFYSNEDAKAESKAQGGALDYVYSRHPDDTVIYAFDINIKNPATTSLMELNNIKSAPSVVINGALHQGVLSASEVEALFKD